MAPRQTSNTSQHIRQLEDQFGAVNWIKNYYCEVGETYEMQTKESAPPPGLVDMTNKSTQFNKYDVLYPTAEANTFKPTKVNFPYCDYCFGQLVTDPAGCRHRNI